MAVQRDITDWYQGEDKTFEFEIKQADGVTAQDITGWTFSMSVSTTPAAAALDTIAGSIQVAASGIVDFVWPSAKTTSGGGATVTSGTNYYSVARTNAGNKTELFYGQAILSPASVKL